MLAFNEMAPEASIGTLLRERPHAIPCALNTRAPDVYSGLNTCENPSFGFLRVQNTCIERTQDVMRPLP